MDACPSRGEGRREEDSTVPELDHILIFSFAQLTQLSVCMQRFSLFPLHPLLKHKWSECRIFDFLYPVTLLPRLKYRICWLCIWFRPKVVAVVWGSGTHQNQAGGGGGSYCNGSSCSGASGGNSNDDGMVQIVELSDRGSCLQFFTALCVVFTGIRHLTFLGSWPVTIADIMRFLSFCRFWIFIVLWHYTSTFAGNVA